MPETTEGQRAQEAEASEPVAEDAELPGSVAAFSASPGEQGSGMLAESVQETITAESGLIRIAFDLSGSDAGYLLIVRPQHRGPDEGLFGHDHYVEVKDQRFGRYGGVRSLRVVNDCRMDVGLAEEVGGVGAELSITTRARLPRTLLSELRGLERG